MSGNTRNKITFGRKGKKSHSQHRAVTKNPSGSRALVLFSVGQSQHQISHHLAEKDGRTDCDF